MGELLEAALAKLRNPYPISVDDLDWFDGYRSHQTPAIDKILEAFKTVDVVLLDAPTGAGKTLIAETVRRLMAASGLYICTTKSLQDQVGRDFPNGRILKGRSNYPTGKYPERFGRSGNTWQGLSCEECTKEPGRDDSCSWCESVAKCPYERAKREALRADLSILNTSYFLNESNGPGRFSGRGLVIVDEADTLEAQLISYVEVTVSGRRAKQYKLPKPKVTVESSWLGWVDDVEPIFKELSYKAAARIKPNSGVPSNNLSDIRESKYLRGLVEKMGWLREGIEDGHWIFTGDSEGIQFKPVRARASNLAERFLFPHGRKWLLMTGTPISPGFMVEEEIGWRGRYKVVTVDSTFPAKNRKVYVKPSGNMSKKEKEVSLGGVLRNVSGIVSTRSERVLIHTVSYGLSEDVVRICKQAGKTTLSYASASERESALSKFKATPGSVLVAPSMDRGIDLPGDLCRVQIIVKMPFPFLGDKQVAKRLYGGGQTGQLWYTVSTIRSVVQMTGRAVRSAEDWAETYILDSAFEGIWKQYQHLFPTWWRESVVWIR